MNWFDMKKTKHLYYVGTNTATVTVSQGGVEQTNTVIAIGTISAFVMGALLLIVTIQCRVLSRQRRSLRFRSES